MHHTPAPTTAGAWLAQAEARLDRDDLFFGHGTDNPGSEAQWLLVGILTQAGVSGITGDTVIPADRVAELDSLLERRITDKVPVAYLLREAWFAGHRFYVDERVLVPRSPVAELIENRFQPLLAREPATILDLCCGGGCIGIACALAFPDSRVVLADLSAEALAVASLNIERFGLADRVSVVQSDLFTDIAGRFDLIVSNPPYVPEDEYRDLPAEFRHEPAMGLVSDRAGLDIPLRILAGAAGHLAPDGALVLETGHTWQALDEAVTGVPLLWLDFEYGGEGVCFVRAGELAEQDTKAP